MSTTNLERDLSGSLAFVTGGATRLGRAMVLGLARRGARLAFTYLSSEDEARETCEEVARVAPEGQPAVAISCDLSSSADVEAAFAQLDERCGAPQLLVNNAAIFERAPVSELSIEDWKRHLDVNLTGSFHCAKLAAERMRASGDEGLIVNMACSSGLRPWPNFLAYGVSKAGLVMLTQALAKDLAPDIRVNAIVPGPMSLDENEAEEQARRAERFTALGRPGRAEDVVRALLFCWDSDYTTGALIPVEGGRMIL